MSVVPPTAPRKSPAPTTARVHRMRVARGACWVIVAALLAGAAVVVLDAAARLPAWVRGVALAAWVTGVGVLVWRLVARRLPPDPDTSPRHARAELPGNLRAAAAAALALAASLLTVTLVPGAGEHVRRVVLPWSSTSTPRFRVKVTSGEPVVRRGDPVTLSAYAEKLDPFASAPDSATLVCRDRGGTELRIPMGGDGRGAFHGTRAGVEAGFEYRVEVGGSSSEWFAVTALDPAEPTGRSSVEITPPRYAPAGGKRVLAGFGAVEGPQHSTAEFRLHFSRAPAAAFLEWRADGASTPEVIPVTLAPDRATGAATLALRRDGTLRLVTVVEDGGKSLRAEFPARVHVVPDAPPRFERLAGVTSRSRAVRPGSVVAVEVAATDDLAVGSATLEYLSGGDDSKSPQVVPIPLSGAGTTRADGRVELDLAGKAGVGETVRLRVRVADTRRLDDPALAPQETVFPPFGWSVIKLDPAAPPTDEAEVIAQRDALGEPALAALEEIKGAQTEVSKLRAGTAGKKPLPLESAVRLTNVRDASRRAAGRLRDAADETALTPDLRPLASAALSAVDGPLKKVDGALARAATDDPAERAAALGTAVELLGETIGRLDRVLSANARLARARLDRNGIAALAAEQAALAGLARPGGAARPDELARLQRDLLTRLRELAAGAEPLRTAVEAAEEREARRLAAAGRELAALLRDLDAAARNLELDTRKDLLRAIAREQGLLVSRATVLGTRAETAARLAGADLPTTAQFVRVAELIESGKTVEALTEIETRAQALDAAAAAVEKWAVEHRDPKAAVRQLGAWQEDLAARVGRATDDDPAKFEALPEGTRAAFAHEQRAIQLAALQLRLPPGDEIRKLYKELYRAVSDATTALGLKGTRPSVPLQAATGAFERLAEAIPTIPERLARARAEFGRVQQTQETIAFAVEQALRGGDAASKLAALHDQQLRQVGAFRALDLPGAEPRVRVASVALAAAADDLLDGHIADAPASQQWVKREFDRLKQELDGQVPPDDRARELAGKLGALAGTVEALGPTPGEKSIRAAAAEAQELAREVVKIGVPVETPALAHDARLAALHLEVAARDAAQKTDEFRMRLRSAADAAGRFADRLSSAETDLERVRRLADARRTAAAEEARRRDKKDAPADATGEAARQLGREADELAHTRVGFAGQALKKKILDQYARLKDQKNPDRQIGAQKELARSLDELAAVMVDLEWLATPVKRVPDPPVPGEADRYLPTAALAADLRDLARDQRALGPRVSSVAGEARKLTRPAEANPLAAVEKKQRVLAAEITAFARGLEAEKDPLAETALDAAIQATLAADGLAVAMVAPADGSADLAAQALRRVATVGGTTSFVRTAADLAARQDVLRGEMNPREPFSPGARAAQQQARGEELARRAGELARSVERLAQLRDAGEPAVQGLNEAAKDASAAGQLITEATRKGADGELREASKLRAAAAGRLTTAAEQVVKHVPGSAAMNGLDPAALNAASSLLRAEAAMRQALDQLEPNPDRSAAEKAMRAAAEALVLAGRERVEVGNQ